MNPIEKSIQFLNEKLKEQNLSESERSAINTELLNLIQQKESQEWLALSPEEKQSKRITWLAKARRSNLNVGRAYYNVALSMLLSETVPFILALNSDSRYNDLLRLCAEEKALLDAAPVARKHVSRAQIDNAFKCFFDTESAISKELFPEAIQQINELYKVLTETASQS